MVFRKKPPLDLDCASHRRQEATKLTRAHSRVSILMIGGGVDELAILLCVVLRSTGDGTSSVSDVSCRLRVQIGCVGSAAIS